MTTFIIFILGFFGGMVFGCIFDIVAKSKELYYVAMVDILPNTNIKDSEGTLIIAKRVPNINKPNRALSVGSPVIKTNSYTNEFIQKGTVLSFDMLNYVKLKETK